MLSIKNLFILFTSNSIYDDCMLWGLSLFSLSLSRSIGASRRRVLNLESCPVCKVLRAVHARVQMSFPVSFGPLWQVSPNRRLTSPRNFHLDLPDLAEALRQGPLQTLDLVIVVHHLLLQVTHPQSQTLVIALEIIIFCLLTTFSTRIGIGWMLTLKVRLSHTPP